MCLRFSFHLQFHHHVSFRKVRTFCAVISVFCLPYGNCITVSNESSLHFRKLHLKEIADFLLIFLFSSFIYRHSSLLSFSICYLCCGVDHISSSIFTSAQCTIVSLLLHFFFFLLLPYFLFLFPTYIPFFSPSHIYHFYFYLRAIWTIAFLDLLSWIIPFLSPFAKRFLLLHDNYSLHLRLYFVKTHLFLWVINFFSFEHTNLNVLLDLSLSNVSHDVASKLLVFHKETSQNILHITYFLFSFTSLQRFTVKI